MALFHTPSYYLLHPKLKMATEPEHAYIMFNYGTNFSAQGMMTALSRIESATFRYYDQRAKYFTAAAPIRLRKVSKAPKKEIPL